MGSTILKKSNSDSEKIMRLSAFINMDFEKQADEQRNFDKMFEVTKYRPLNFTLKVLGTLAPLWLIVLAIDMGNGMIWNGYYTLDVIKWSLIIASPLIGFSIVVDTINRLYHKGKDEINKNKLLNDSKDILNQE